MTCWLIRKYSNAVNGLHNCKTRTPLVHEWLKNLITYMQSMSLMLHGEVTSSLSKGLCVDMSGDGVVCDSLSPVHLEKNVCLTLLFYFTTLVIFIHYYSVWKAVCIIQILTRSLSNLSIFFKSAMVIQVVMMTYGLVGLQLDPPPLTAARLLTTLPVPPTAPASTSLTSDWLTPPVPTPYWFSSTLWVTLYDL